MAETSKSLGQIGFLTTIDLPDRGVSGGLLVTTLRGRPLEFQCTTPLAANRTQEILYGPTLDSYLKAELVAATLIERAQVKPKAVFTDDAAIVDVRQQISLPVALLVRGSGTSLPSHLSRRHIEDRALAINTDIESDTAVLSKLLKEMPREADLWEPFDRVREALNEALRQRAA